MVSPTVQRNIKAAFFFASRLCSLAFLAIACATLPQVVRLAKNEYLRDGNTIMIPLQMCAPQSIEFEGGALLFSGDEVGECHALTYVVAACAASIVFGIAALLLFFVFDGMVRLRIGPFKIRTVLGMSFYLGFSLIQAAVCCWALYKETSSRQAYFATMFANAQKKESVATYGDPNSFYRTMVLALTTASLLIVDSIYTFFFGLTVKRKEETPEGEQSRETSPEQPNDP